MKLAMLSSMVTSASVSQHSLTTSCSEGMSTGSPFITRLKQTSVVASQFPFATINGSALAATLINRNGASRIAARMWIPPILCPPDWPGPPRSARGLDVRHEFQLHRPGHVDMVVALAPFDVEIGRA